MLPRLHAPLLLVIFSLSACAADVGGATLALESAEYPDAEWHAAHPDNYMSGRAGNEIEMVIIHTAEGSFEGTIGWFSNPSAMASTQYVVSSDGDVAQMVAESDTAWHAGNDDYSRRSIGIEHEGFVAEPDRWYTDRMYEASAALVRYLCDEYDVPIDRDHIIGHNEVPNPYDPTRKGGVSGHTDPGDGWDWRRFMTLVREAGAEEEEVEPPPADLPPPPRAPIALESDGQASTCCAPTLTHEEPRAVRGIVGGCATTSPPDGGAALALLLFLFWGRQRRRSSAALAVLALLPFVGACAASTQAPLAGCDDPSGRSCAIETDAAMPPDADRGPIVEEEPEDEESACGAMVFALTDTQEDFVVPDDVRYMHVKAWGAGGNHEGGCDFPDGGVGGFTEAVFAVGPGDELTVIVGHLGRSGTTGESRNRFGFGAWGGGGLSGVFEGHDEIHEEDFDRALVIAGGGGSASTGCSPGGPGNHTDAGGQETMHGEFGPDGLEIVGGGGGYRGGLAGARGVGARGGSGYVAPHAEDSRLLYSTIGDPLPPATDDDDYAEEAGQNERDGRVVIRFECEVPGLV
jgi:uncharacterized protein (TIGR03382 family)